MLHLLYFEGGHPHNWNQLSSQCLVILENYLEALKTANKECLKKCQKSSIIDNLGNVMSPIKPQKLLLKKMNESLRIRPLMTPPPIKSEKTQTPYAQAFTSTPTQSTIYRSICPKSSTSTPVLITTPSISSNLKNKKDKKKNLQQNINEQISFYYDKATAAIQNRLLNLPGIYYLFHKSKASLCLYTLSNAEMIIWILQGLGGICTASLHEDSYGVVQSILPQFLTILLNFNEELDKMEMFLNNHQKDENTNLINLQKSVNRVLHKIACAFGDYLHDFIDDTYKLAKLKRYSKYEM